ncbi:intraflagellar transport protein 57/55 [Novymonas esmeraldas]|uniref:Intraflagellar transport protein 57/55 n=1 Tax=Novymonas esmeraldas TaxID=1808958 RepID=A0AAW0EN80_9TRYP
MSEEAAAAKKPPTEAAASGMGVDDSTMSDIVDKLRMLKYETNFCRTFKPPFSPLNPYYFSGPSSMDNPNAQFYYFTSLCAWLMKLCGHQFDAPGQFDDPNASSTTILAELRSMNIAIPNIAPTRLKQGSGEAVLAVLSALVNAALSSTDYDFEPVDYRQVDRYDELAAVADAEDEQAEDEIEDHVVIDSDDDDEVYIRAVSGHRSTKGDADRPPTPRVDVEEWKIEVERVAPLLHVRQSSLDDWRSRIESATVLLKAVETMYPEVKQMLERLAGDMDKSRDRIQKREQTLAQQFSDQVEDYRVKLRELNTSRDSANVAQQTVQQMTVELNQVSELLDQTKRDIAERQAKISDTTPLIQVKEAVVKVQAEIKLMSLRIGILQNGVLQHVMRQTKSRREGPTVDGTEMYSGEIMFS